MEILRVVSDLVEAQLAEMRRTGGEVRHRSDWTAETRLRDVDDVTGAGSLGADSLELLELAARVNQFFHLHEWGTEENLLRYRDLGSWADVVRQSLQDDWRRLTFQTSGSGGRPKKISHDRGDLEQEAKSWLEIWPGIKRCVTLVPSHHLYGFIWTVLLPELGHWEVVDGRFWSPERLVREIREGDLVVGVPFRWDLLDRFGGAVQSGVSGVSSAGALAPPLWERLREGGWGRLMEVYGSTETGGVGCRQSEAEPYRLMPSWKRGSKAGCLVRNESNEIELMDRLHWETENSFRAEGRIDRGIKVGGIVVHPDSVEAILGSHPDVAACAVKSGEAETGRLRAYVVQKPGGNRLSEEGLSQWLSSRLPSSSIPRCITFGSALPIDGNGKAVNW